MFASLGICMRNLGPRLQERYCHSRECTDRCCSFYRQHKRTGRCESNYGEAWADPAGIQKEEQAPLPAYPHSVQGGAPPSTLQIL